MNRGRNRARSDGEQRALGQSVRAALSLGFSIQALLQTTRIQDLENVEVNLGFDVEAEVSRARALASAYGIGFDVAVALNRARGFAAANGLGFDMAAALNVARSMGSAAPVLGFDVAVTLARARNLSASNGLGFDMSALLEVEEAVTPGSSTFDTPGANNFIVPNYTTLEVELWGGGGSGCGCVAGPLGTDKAGNNDATDSTISAKSLLAGKGAPGTAWNAGGAGGTASGGDTNTSGGSSTNGHDPSPTAQTTSFSGPGGLSPNGGATKAAVTCAQGGVTHGVAGNAPGGGATGGCRSFFIGGDGVHCRGGRGGGGGAYCKKTYTKGVTSGAPTPGDSLAYVVGAGGTYTNGAQTGVFYNAAGGANGRVKFTWS